jgi:5'-nucleotidase / UDP-sugar diphosphatase
LASPTAKRHVQRSGEIGYIRSMTLSRRLLLGALGTLPLTRLAAGAPAHRLTILHMNDFHARHEPVDARALACAPGRPACFGGAARLATAILAERAAAEADGRAVLLVDAGDQFQGSLFYTAWKGEVELAVMHALGTEAMAVGNHEFDHGPANLARFARAARFPVLSANTDASADPDLRDLIRPHALVGKGGLSLGLVGLTTRETAISSSPGPHVRFTDPAEALARSAAALRQQGARLVIALSHLGLDIDRTLAGHIAGVDVVVGGHTHTLLSNTEPDAAGPAHQAVEGSAGRAVIVQAAAFGRYLGRLDIDLAADGAVLAYGGDCRHVPLSLAEEPRVAAIVTHYALQLDGVRRRVVGRTEAAIPNATCRIGECALGSFIADAMLASVQGAEVALMNAGGIRTGLPGGELTLGDVLTMLPFGNAVATLQLSGADLQAAIANGLARMGAGAFPQVAGLRITWNPTAAPEARLVAMDVATAAGWAPIEPGRVYRVVTNNFLRTGGDGYTMLRDRAIDPYDSGPGLDDVVAAAITASGSFAPRTAGRFLTR